MNYNNWYALSIGINKENSAKSQLLARIEVMKDRFIKDVQFLKKKELVIEKSGKRRIKEVLLMSGYLLVQVEPQEIENEDGTISKEFPGESFDLILGTPGIKFFVNCDKEKPIPFRPREIKKLFDMCDDAHLEVKQNINRDYDIGDILDVVSGPFSGYKAEVVNVQGEKLLGQLDMFGRVIPVEFTFDQVYKS